MAHDVFISYSHREKTIADDICSYFERAGIRCWIAPRDIPEGAEYPERVVEGIMGARIIVLILSKSANASPWVPREIERAVNYNLPIYVFRIEEVEPARSMELPLASSQRFDAFPKPGEFHIKRLAQRVQDNLGKHIPPPPPPPPPGPGKDIRGMVRISAMRARTGGVKRVSVNEQAYDLPFWAGIVDGEVIRYPGLGEPGSNGRPAGDLLLTYRVTPEKPLGQG